MLTASDHTPIFTAYFCPRSQAFRVSRDYAVIGAWAFTTLEAAIFYANGLASDEHGTVEVDA